MNTRPQSWDELRRLETTASTGQIPDALRGLTHEPPRRQREIKYLDRTKLEEMFRKDGRSSENDAFRPTWLENSFSPRRAPTRKPVSVRHHGHELEPAITYQPDERKIYDDRSYPYGCVCKIRTAAGAKGSGVLIGPRHVLTASHCVDWSTSDAEKIEVHLTGTTAAAVAYDTVAYAFTRISGDPTVTTLDEDYACLVLDQRLGDAFGWMGTKTYDSDWDGDNVWWSLGYPGDIADGEWPTWMANKSMDEDEWDYGSGRAMTTAADMEKGQSGAPMFGWWDGVPYAVAVMSAYGNVWFSGVENWCSGGSDLGRIVKQARDENP